MNNIDIANGIIFQKMSITKETFDDRLICQKKIYLLQCLGTNLGYTYNWYVRGPYSPDLTNYIYRNLKILVRNNFKKYRISEKVEANIDKINKLENDKNELMTNIDWYELLASLLYINKNKNSWKINLKEEDTKKALFDELIKYKPKYNIEECEKAYKILNEKGFLGDEK